MGWPSQRLTGACPGGTGTGRHRRRGGDGCRGRRQVTSVAVPKPGSESDISRHEQAELEPARGHDRRGPGDQGQADDQRQTRPQIIAFRHRWKWTVVPMAHCQSDLPQAEEFIVVHEDDARHVNDPEQHVRDLHDQRTGRPRHLPQTQRDRPPGQAQENGQDGGQQVVSRALQVPSDERVEKAPFDRRAGPGHCGRGRRRS